MRLTPYDPLRSANGLRGWLYDDDFARFMTDFFRPMLQEEEGSSVLTSAWSPSVDIEEQDKQYVVRADVPGIDPKDIEVTMDNGVLTIKGERESESKKEGKDYKRVERMHGSFQRRFTLPEDVDPKTIEAKGRNGVLEITLHKSKETAEKKRRIEVKG